MTEFVKRHKNDTALFQVLSRAEGSVTAKLITSSDRKELGRDYGKEFVLTKWVEVPLVRGKRRNQMENKIIHFIDRLVEVEENPKQQSLLPDKPNKPNKPKLKRVPNAYLATAQDELGQFVTKANKNSLTLRVGDWRGIKELTVKATDVAEYYATQASNLTSGVRTLAGHSGDWRNIDQLANYCLHYFKKVNPEAVRKAAAKYGLIAKF